jgi:hypothetical protein
MKIFQKKLSICVTNTIFMIVSGGKFLPAQAISITFDDLPTQPVNGLTVQDVTFGFKINGVDSTDALYNSIGPGIVTYVQDPSLGGSSKGVLSLDFAKPVSDLSFGVVLSTFSNVTPGFNVQLFNSNLASIETIPVDTKLLFNRLSGAYPEGQFSYSNPNFGVKRALVSFADFVDPFGSPRFALDNLRATEIPKVPLRGL